MFSKLLTTTCWFFADLFTIYLWTINDEFPRTCPQDGNELIDHKVKEFQHADNIVSGLLAFIGAVSEGPSWSFSNAVKILIIQSSFNKACLTKFQWRSQSPQTSVLGQVSYRSYLHNWGSADHKVMIFLVQNCLLFWCYYIQVVRRLLGTVWLRHNTFCHQCKNWSHW